MVKADQAACREARISDAAAATLSTAVTDHYGANSSQAGSPIASRPALLVVIVIQNIAAYDIQRFRSASRIITASAVTIAATDAAASIG